MRKAGVVGILRIRCTPGSEEVRSGFYTGRDRCTGFAWLLHQPAVTAPIVGATRLEHLEDAVAALGRTPRALKRLDLLRFPEVEKVPGTVKTDSESKHGLDDEVMNP